MEILFEHPLLRVTLDRAAGIVRYERTEQPWPSIDDVRRVHDRFFEVVFSMPQGAYALLLDVRRAPPRNDDEYESVIGGYMDRLIRHFRKCALLVKTAAGRLQVLRLERHAKRPAAAVFLDEAEALAHLASAAPPS
jgi:hypothetical protein